MALIFLVIIELFFRLIENPNDSEKNLQVSATVSRQSWGAQYQKDLAPYLWIKQHSLFTEFRERPYASDTINIDNDGIRKTHFSNCKKDSPQIWVFGGSTVLGAGVPDEGTLPSQLAKVFNENSKSHCVINYGGNWWTSSQSFIQLYRLLVSGKRPESIVFLDGINDFDVVTYGGKAGGIAPSHHEELKRAFATEDERAQFSIGAMILKHSASIRYLNKILSPPDREKTALKPEEQEKMVAPTIAKQQFPTEAKGIADVYTRNVKMATSLAETFHFNAFFFLQPFPMFSNKPLSKAEKNLMKNSYKRKWEKDLLDITYGEIDKNLRSHKNWFNVSQSLDLKDEEIFSDGEHLLPLGNYYLAQIIYTLMTHPEKKAN